MRSTTSLSLSLAIVTSLLAGGCMLPNALLGPEDTSVASVLSSGGAARLFELAIGGDEVSVPISGDRPALMVFNSRAIDADRLAVNIQPDRQAYRVQGLATSEAPAGTPGFEARLRRYETRFDQVPAPKTHYKVAAAPFYQLGDKAQFWVIRDVAGNDTTEGRISATARYVGENCYVFVDNQVSGGRLDERIAEIGKAFDEKIFPTDTRLFGAPLASGVNGDTRITLLISPAVGNYGNDSTIGYFTVRDLFSPELAPKDPILARSNQRLMLYISSGVVSRGKPADYLGTIAHELQHLINASQRLFRAKTTKTEDVWLDEGLSMYAMEANGYGLSGAGGVVYDHVAAFQAAPGAYSLTNWDLNPDQSGYGAVYLFTTYLADRFGEGVLKELISSSLTGVGNVDAAVRAKGSSFASVFSDWTIANLLDHTSMTTDPRFNYRSISMLGTYGGKRLRGMHLESVSLPNRGSLSFKPTSARYYYIARGNSGTYRFNLAGEGGQDFGGLVVAP